MRDLGEAMDGDGFTLVTRQQKGTGRSTGGGATVGVASRGALLLSRANASTARASALPPGAVCRPPFLIWISPLDFVLREGKKSPPSLILSRNGETDAQAAIAGAHTPHTHTRCQSLTFRLTF